MRFDYYYGTQADQFSFIRIPKVMLTGEMFASLSLQSKMLYGLLLDRLGLSRKNGWFDAENKAYIIYQISEIQEDLNFSKKKAIDYLSELEEFGLVEKKRRGRGLPSIIYVKSFLLKQDCKETDTNMSETTCKDTDAFSISIDNDASRSADSDTSRSVDMVTSRGSDIELQEVPKSTPPINNTKLNNTEENNNESNHIISAKENNNIQGCGEDAIREMNAYEEIIKENIRYDDLLVSYPYDQDIINGIKQLILEVAINKKDSMVIASNKYPMALVKSKFLKLEYSHIEYVMDCFQNNSAKVKNIKKYLLAALFNAPSTIGSYYRAEVNHDMSYDTSA